MEFRHENALRRTYQADKGLGDDGLEPETFHLLHTGGMEREIDHPRWDISWAAPSEHTIDDLEEMGWLRVEPHHDKRRSFTLTIEGRRAGEELLNRVQLVGEGEPTLHVRVEPIDAVDMMSGPIYALDLSEEEVIRGFIAPYQRREAISYNGRCLASYRKPKVVRYNVSGIETVGSIRANLNQSSLAYTMNQAEELFFEKSAKDVSETYLSAGEPETVRAQQPTPGAEETPPLDEKRSIFVVHGHGRKDEVARFLQRVTGEEPKVLSELPGRGKTIIEKFEMTAGAASYAVVLLTADDVGAAKSQSDSLTPRARQNVILELGYFIGKIGRENVAVLYEEGVDLPSDYRGVEYIPFSKDWKLKLIAELKDAGFEVTAAI